MCDATEGMTSEDFRIAEMAMNNNCATVIALNKWDETDTDLEDARARVAKKLRQRPRLMAVSAKSGPRPAAADRRGAGHRRPRRRADSTPELNRFLSDLQGAKQPPATRGRRLKMYYMAQFQVTPPRFAVQVNDRSADHARLRLLPREPAARAVRPARGCRW